VFQNNTPKKIDMKKMFYVVTTISLFAIAANMTYSNMRAARVMTSVAADAKIVQVIGRVSMQVDSMAYKTGFLVEDEGTIKFVPYDPGSRIANDPRTPKYLNIVKDRSDQIIMNPLELDEVSPVKLENIEKHEGAVFNTVGALTYMLDQNRKPISDGYHEFAKLSDGTWIGKLGSLKYILKNGKKCSLGFQEITATATGYEAELGSEKYTLNKNGDVVSKS